MATPPSEFAAAIKDEISRHVLGLHEPVRLLMTALIAGGHVLLEDMPGLGKTLLAKTLAGTLALDFKRIQCTPDLLPSDVTGVAVYDQTRGAFDFQPGPIHANVVLVDEINRATPRTQASFLEAMQEGQVTAEGETRPLPRPFLMIATQNPVEFEGTFPLPEAQLDRFLMRISMGYPDRETEGSIVDLYGTTRPSDGPAAVAGADDIFAQQQAVADVTLSPPVRDYLIDLVRATRNHPDIHLPASPRASVALSRAARAAALLEGRNFVIPDDVKGLAEPILGHRIVLTRDASLRGISAAGVIAGLLREVPVPVEDADGGSFPGEGSSP